VDTGVFLRARWREFVDRKDTFCFWSIAVVIAKGLGHWQNRYADKFASQLRCHWNREPLELVRQPGLKIAEAQRLFLGIFFVRSVLSL
jgi:hypothetical protein